MPNFLCLKIQNQLIKTQVSLSHHLLTLIIQDNDFKSGKWPDHIRHCRLWPHDPFLEPELWPVLPSPSTQWKRNIKRPPYATLNLPIFVLFILSKSTAWQSTRIRLCWLLEASSMCLFMIRCRRIRMLFITWREPSKTRSLSDSR